MVVGLFLNWQSWQVVRWKLRGAGSKYLYPHPGKCRDFKRVYSPLTNFYTTVCMHFNSIHLSTAQDVNISTMILYHQFSYRFTHIFTIFFALLSFLHLWFFSPEDTFLPPKVCALEEPSFEGLLLANLSIFVYLKISLFCFLSWRIFLLDIEFY